MSTLLKGKVERETSLRHRGRAIVVGIEEPGYIIVRVKGTQLVERAPASAVLEYLTKRRVDEELARRPGRRRQLANRGLLA